MTKLHPAYNALVASSSMLRAKVHEHIADWELCGRCPLNITATHVVIGRGDLPCDILFIGEAPGNSENDLGKPFIGRSGKLLEGLIEHSQRRLKRTHKITWKPRYAITNVVGCIPTDGDRNKDGYVFRQPTDAEAYECSPRLARFLQLASPKGIVLMGGTARRLAARTVSSVFPKERAPAIHECYHPSYLLRVGGPASVEYKNWLIELTRFLRDIYNNHPSTR